ncbi:MAG: DUF6056 family protein [Prosthecobacter sp.]|uniref:DUF6056 family protein n=1 Tax=Prosthecobacter sp. TaxID=1965333 RepID=UPI0025D2F8AD|nr:DUF6056 family protein [Prosthecobacter sp.]MCF7787342.1 DUF6056 family protein [Prosthecobacter sp.]
MNTSLVWLLALIGISPFVLLCCYAQPSADDWYMAADTMEKGYWQSNIDFYLGLTGRFFSSAVLFLHPMLLSFGAFKCYSLALILGLVVSLRWAVGGWFPETSSGWKWLLVVTSSVLFLWAMPSTAQGFYWGTGSAGYTLPGLLSLCLAGMFGRRCLDSGWRPQPVMLVIASLMAIAITGCTEVAMALFFAHLVVLNAVFFWRHRQVSRPLAILLAATLIGVAAVVLTPGNSVRRTWYTNDVNHVFVPAVLMALKLALRQLAVWLTFAPFFLFSLVIVSAWPAALQLSRQRAWELIVIAVVLMGGTLFGGFFLGTWSMGAAIPLRGINLLLLFFIIDWIILLAGIIALLRTCSIELPRAGVVLSLCAFLIFCSNAQMSVGNNIKAAWLDLLSGRAAQYEQQCAQRHALIRAATTPDVLVPILTARPYTLFFNDLTADPANWRNVGCARFFRKHSVALQP